MAAFTYPDFSSTSGLTILSDAATSGVKMRLTPAAINKVGVIWYATKVPVNFSWVTIFEFQITGGGGIANPGHESHGPGGDGLSFCIQNDGANDVGGGGSGLGYGGLPNSLAVEFDTYDDFTFGDGGDNEVSIHSKGTSMNSSDADGIIGANHQVTPNMKGGSIHTGKVVYASNSMQVYLDNTLIQTESINLSTLLSLDSNKAWVGLTGATGAAYQNNDIISWSFHSFEPTAPGVFLDEIFFRASS